MNRSHKKINIVFTIVILGISLLSLLVVRTQIVGYAIFRLIGLIALLFLIYQRLFLTNVHGRFKDIATYIETSALIFFVSIFILATGGITSPYLILAHFLTIGIAILLTPTLSVSFILSFLTTLLANFMVDPSQKIFWESNPLVGVIYLISFIIVIPIAYIFAKQYSVKEEWIEELTRQVSIGEIQERTVLGNITEGVCIINTQFQIVWFNKTASDILEWKEAEVYGKNCLNLFTFKDEKGNELKDEENPFIILLDIGKSFLRNNLLIQKNGKDFIKVDAKFSPVLDAQGQLLGGILIFEDTSHLTELQKVQHNITSLALFKFQSLLSVNRDYFSFLKEKALPDLLEKDVNRIILNNEQLFKLIEDFTLALNLQKGEVEISMQLADIYASLKQQITKLQNVFLEKEISLRFNLDNKSSIASDIKGELKFDDSFSKQLFSIADKKFLDKSFRDILSIAAQLTGDKKEIVLAVEKDEGSTHIKINCHSPKLTSNKVKLLDKMFYRGDPDLTKLLEKSTGLEIFNTNNLIERMGGRFTIEDHIKAKGILSFTYILNRRPNPEENG